MTQPEAKPKNGLAITTLIVGIFAFFTGLIPWVGLLLGLSAFALGVFALTRGQSKPLALTGGSLGAVAAITGLISTIALMAWLIGAPGSA
ncbi:hypothetical protein Q9S36_04805 [Microbacterium sp. ARD31]|uniref:hypothetical protein n=1 Tax=Microbacterium sp. ARD31 TaxID=2962576 RepID=UPI002882C6B7|nr:hypothetical protein [Microbacterium sp. ARD31]MDT0179530.1 hypothetical protein [Microbacterium sp. ARD31]